MNLSDRELATVLASLRYFQDNEPDWFPHFTDVTPLTSDEIDSLCERLNVQPDADG